MVLYPREPGLWSMRVQLTERLHLRSETAIEELEKLGVEIDKPLDEWIGPDMVTGRQIPLIDGALPGKRGSGNVSSWWVECRRVKVVE